MLTTFGTVLLLLEGGTRLLNTIYPMTQGFPTKSTALWERRFIRLNSLGYRDREHPVRRPDRTQRILLVGDSFTVGHGIKDPEERLGERLQEGLNRLSTHVKYEVINAGKPDSHTLDHIEVLKRMRPYQSDYVFLVYVFNDFEHVTKPARSVVTDMRTHFDRLHPLRLLVLNSHLAEQIFLRVRKGLYRYMWSKDGSAPADPYDTEDVLKQHLEALEYFFRSAQEVNSTARLIPFDIRVQFGESEMIRYEKFVRTIAAIGIPVWSLAEAFRGYRYDDLTVNSFDGHPNALANQLAANAVVERFRLEFLGFNRDSSTLLKEGTEDGIQAKTLINWTMR